MNAKEKNAINDRLRTERMHARRVGLGEMIGAMLVTMLGFAVTIILLGVM